MPKKLSAFPQHELERALAEQSFGIKAFKLVDKSSELEASATIQLLEGHWIQLTLTTYGYRVCALRFLIFARPSSTLSQLHVRDGIAGDSYETVENALEHASPLYSKAKQEVLSEKLSALQETRSRTSSRF